MAEYVLDITADTIYDTIPSLHHLSFTDGCFI